MNLKHTIHVQKIFHFFTLASEVNNIRLHEKKHHKLLRFLILNLGLFDVEDKLWSFRFI